MVRCEVKNCNYTRENDALFPSPRNKDLLKLWQDAVDTKLLEFFVCEQHFPKDNLIIKKRICEGDVPSINLSLSQENSIKLENIICGFCLVELQIPKFLKIQGEFIESFKEITGNEPLTDMMCKECASGLTKYRKFKTQIKRMHENIRKLVNEKIKIKDESIVQKSYDCSFCGNFSADQSLYVSHLRDEHSFQCDHCPFVCKNSLILDSHSLGHYETLEQRCSSCNVAFKTKASLDIHNFRAHKVKEFGCLQCDNTYSEPIQLRLHNILNHPSEKQPQILPQIPEPIAEPIPEQKKVSLKECSDQLVSIIKSKRIRDELTFDDDDKEASNDVEMEEEPEIPIESLEEGIEEKGEEVFAENFEGDDKSEEDDDDDWAIPQSNNIDHNRDAEGMLLRCLDCGLHFNVEELLKHRTEKHPDNMAELNAEMDAIPRIYNDTLIPKESFKNPERYLVHCEYCFLELPEGKLERHIKNVHPKDKKPFMCHLCSKQFDTEAHFKNHLIYHSPEKMLICDICDRRIPDVGNMRIHMSFHMGTHKKFKERCSICLKGLSMKQYGKNFVQIHMDKFHPNGYDCGARVNMETNMFDCYKCGAAYLDIYTYRKHSCERGRFQMRCEDCKKVITRKKMKRHKEKGCMIKDGFGRMMFKFRPLKSPRNLLDS